MINYTWKILKIFSKNELITGVKYKLIDELVFNEYIL